MAKKEIKETGEVQQVPESQKDKRDRLIAEIKPKLLSNSKLRTGGGAVRSKYSQEVANFSPVLNEINALGKILGQPPVGLGSLREE